MDLFTHEGFLRDFEALRLISLNSQRHLAKSAHAHTLLVVERTRQLCEDNGVGAEDTARLVALAYLHDIGKSRGTSRPQKSVELLGEYGIDDGVLIRMVKYHDINLPWFQSHQRGEAPSDKAWRKLAREVDLALLCLFMVADRVDCPGGFRANAALSWFLREAEHRGALPTRLLFGDEGLTLPET